MYPKKGGGVGILWRNVSSREMRRIGKSAKMSSIILYLNKRRMGGIERAYMDIHI